MANDKCPTCGTKLLFSGRLHDHACKQRLEMRNTPEGQFLWKMGLDYYDTESSARRVAEAAVEEIEKLKKENKELKSHYESLFTSLI